MVRLLWTCCLGLLAAPAAMAVTVSTAVDPGYVEPGGSTVVIYTVDEQVAEPDFTPLEQDFEILDRSRAQRITITGGRTRVEVTWKLVIRPRRSGELSLPRLPFGDQLSEPRTITVASRGVAAGGNGDLRIDYSVDDRTPYVSQQMVLTVTVRAVDGIEDLDISTPRILEGRGRIDELSRTRRHQTGRSSRRYEVHQQRYTLVPDAAGTLRLSPIEVRGRVDGDAVSERSAPLELAVSRTPASDSARDGEVAPDDLFLEVEIDKRSPYVQEQVLYTVRVLRAVAINNATLAAPVVRGGDAVIERLGTDRRYQVARGGRHYSVTERRFAVFPQTSGTLTIEPARLSASVQLPTSGRGTTGFANQLFTRSVQVESEPRELDVKAPPPGAPSPWLPARQVTLVEDWPERDRFEVGTPVTRRITLSADALMGSQLPELDVPLPAAVSTYPERPRRETGGGEQGISGRLEQTMVIVPSQAGTLTVPALELEWWNTATDRKETLRLPAHTLEVTERPSPPSYDATRSSGPKATASGTAQPPRAAWWLSLSLGLAWLATLVLWWRDRRRLVGAAGRGAPEPPVGASRRRAETRLRNACRAGDPRAARDAMLEWGRACWPDRPPRSLGALGRTTSDALATELAELQRALYAPDAAAWQGNGLYRAVVSFDPEQPRRRRAGYTLKPLYEH